MDENLRSGPPSDIEAEKALLGSILVNNKRIDDVADKVKSEYFYDPRNRIVYLVMLDLWSKNHPIDILYVLNQLKNSPYTKDLTETEIIDKDFLLELVSKNTLSGSVEFTGKIIKNKSLLRTIVETSDEMKSLALESNNEPDDILDQAQQKLYDISLKSVDKNFIPISEVLSESFERISELYNNQVDFRGIPTGFTDVDKILGGFHNSDLIILAARPSMGKTALALEFARRIAMNRQVGTAIFSLEMGKEQLVDRLLSVVSGIDSWKIRTGKFADDPENNEFMRLGQAIGKLDQTPIWIDDGGGLNVMELRSKARRLKSRHNIGVIFIDYLQLMSSSHNKYAGNRVQEVSEISRGLKLLARELNIPIIALSQLSRSVEGREDKRPMLSDLRESGSIEQDADVVMFIHREDRYHKETKRKNIADILVSKHRNGRTGTVELAWIEGIASFENLDGARIRSSIGE